MLFCYNQTGDPLYDIGGQPKAFESESMGDCFANDGYASLVFYNVCDKLWGSEII